MPISLLHTFTQQRVIFILSFLFLFQLSGFSVSSKTKTKEKSRISCFVSKKKLQKKSIIIKTQSTSAYEMEVVIELCDSDFDTISLNDHAVGVDILMPTNLENHLLKLVGYRFFVPERSSPPPKQ